MDEYKSSRNIVYTTTLVGIIASTLYGCGGPYASRSSGSDNGYANSTAVERAEARAEAAERRAEIERKKEKGYWVCPKNKH